MNFVKNLAKILAFFIAGTSLVMALEVNLATQSELDSIKGIGPVKAKAIVEERTKNGSFKDSKDLAKRVTGLGEKTVTKLQENGLTIGGKIDTGINVKDTKLVKQSKTEAVNKQDNKSDSLSKTEKPIKYTKVVPLASSTASNEASKPVVIKHDKKQENKTAKLGINAKVNTATASASHSSAVTPQISNTKEKVKQ